MKFISKLKWICKFHRLFPFLLSLIALCLNTGCQVGDRAIIKEWRRLFFHGQEITIYADNRWEKVVASSSLPKDWLNQSKIELAAADSIVINGVKWNAEQPYPFKEPIVVQVKRAQLIQLNDNGQGSVVRSSEPTIIAALQSQGHPLYWGDRITPNIDYPLDKSIAITITRSKPIRISDGVFSLSTRSSATNVRQALLEAEVALQAWDEPTPALDSPLPQDGMISISRIQEKLMLDYDLTPFSVERRTLADVEEGQKVILQEGAQGVSVTGEWARVKGDAVIFQEQLPQWKVRDAQTLVLGIGSKLVPKTLAIPGGKITYYQAIPMYATSYSPCRMGKPNVCDYTTATGARLQKGVVAVTREDFALFGNGQVYIPGYGFATVADVGGGIPGKRWIDLGYSEEDYQPWSREVMVYIVASIEMDNQ